MPSSIVRTVGFDLTVALWVSEMEVMHKPNINNVLKITLWFRRAHSYTLL